MEHLDRPNRRNFLRKSSQLTMGAALASSVLGSADEAMGANERIRVACVGLRGRGKDHIKRYLQLQDEGVELVALCDVDEQILEERADSVEKEGHKRPKTYWDIRKLLEDASIDAISVVTPNHWHALATVWACQAGKDVYVEKPVSWCIGEGRAMVDAARRHKRIVQVGTQARSFSHVRERIEELQAGLIGDIYMARALCYKRRESLGFKEPGEAPSHIHFDQWLGPAPVQPFHGNLVHYNWHWFWDFGNGDLGNQAVHEIDIARWGLGKGLPTRVHCTGGRFGYEDQGETPNTVIANYSYDDGKTIVCEVRGRYTHAEKGVQLGNLFYGSEGYLPGANWGGSAEQHPHQNQEEGDWQPEFGYGGKRYGGLPPKQGGKATEKSGKDGLNEDLLPHFRNFVKAIRSRNHEDLNADILEGHISAAMVHMANISYRLGCALSFDPKTERFVGENAAKANRFLMRDHRKPFAI